MTQQKKQRKGQQKKGGSRNRQRSKDRNGKLISNRKAYDSSSKIIFGNAELCSQFLRNYMDMPILENICAEDIEDVSERYVPMFTEERYADTVKRVKISENDTLFSYRKFLDTAEECEAFFPR